MAHAGYSKLLTLPASLCRLLLSTDLPFETPAGPSSSVILLFSPFLTQSVSWSPVTSYLSLMRAHLFTDGTCKKSFFFFVTCSPLSL